MKQNRTAGFTLIELLAVIAVIGVMAALSIPILNGVREKAMLSTATNNLKGIGAALMQYAGDHNGNFPVVGGDIPYKTDPSPGAKLSWQQSLDPYIDYTGKSPNSDDQRKIFTLTARPPKYARWGDNAFFMGAHAAQAEFKLQNGVGDVPALNMLKIQRPSMHILAGEQASPGPYTAKDSDKDDYDLNNPAFGSDKVPDRIVQILFADGHVGSFTKFDNTLMTVRYEGVHTDGPNVGKGYNYGEE